MRDFLEQKKAIFFDVGYTLDYPASGDWMFTNRFYDFAAEQLKKCTHEEILRARTVGMDYLAANHLVFGVEAEIQQMVSYYSLISDELGLKLTQDAILDIAKDRSCNMRNYILYPDAKKVLEALSKRYRLGIISDTWPSIENQLRTLGIRAYFSFCTYSCDLGVFKPDPKMYLDALKKSGCDASETVFIDDRPANLESAAALGITPVLIAANPESDVEVPYLKIHSLSELIGI